MPELPEVETVRRALESALKGAVTKSVELRRKDLRIPFPKGFAEDLAGRTITGVTRRAKYLLIGLDSGKTVIAHLGMSGRFLVHARRPERLMKHDHLVMNMKDGRCVVYNDARRFGLMTMEETLKLNKHPLLAGLGPEPMSDAFSPIYLKQVMRESRMPVKTFIMDQRVVVGVGNIYACEALFDCGINPKLPAKAASGHANALRRSVRKVLAAAIDSGGSSLRDFVNIGGESGYFQHAFSVYGREGEECIKCATVIERITQSGRSTFFCPACQK